MALTTSITIRLRDEFTKGIRAMRGSMKGFNGALDKAQKGFNIAGQMNLAAAGAQRLSRQTIGLLSGPINAAKDFEEAIAELGANTQTVGTPALESMRDVAADLGETTQFSATQAAQGMLELGRAGLDAEQIMATIPSTLDLAKAGSLELAAAADIATNIMSGMRLEADQSQRVMDVLAQTASNSNTDVRGLGEAMKFVAPDAETLGLSVEETAATLGVLAKNGIKGTMAGTNLRATLKRLAAPTSMAKGRLNELGVELDDGEGNIKNWNALLTELAGSMDGLTGKEQSAALADIFGRRAGTAANILIKEAKSGGIEKFVKLTNEADGRARDMAATMEETTAGQFKAFESKLEALKISIGNELLPVLIDLMDSLAPLVKDLAQWARENPELVRQIGKSLIAFGGLTAALSPLLLTMGTTVAAVSTFRSALSVGSGLTGVLRTAAGGTSALNSNVTNLGVGAGTAGGKLGKAASALQKVGAAAASLGAGFAVGKMLNAGAKAITGESLSEAIESRISKWTGNTGARGAFEGEGDLPPGTQITASDEEIARFREKNGIPANGRVRVEVDVRGKDGAQVDRQHTTSEGDVDVDAGPQIPGTP